MLFIPGSYHQACASYNFYNKFDHNAIIVAFQPHRIKSYCRCIGPWMYYKIVVNCLQASVVLPDLNN